MNQGYAYKVVNQLPGMEKENLGLATKVGFYFKNIFMFNLENVLFEEM